MISLLLHLTQKICLVSKETVVPKFGIKQADKGEITTVKELRSRRFER